MLGGPEVGNSRPKTLSGERMFIDQPKNHTLPFAYRSFEYHTMRWLCADNFCSLKEGNSGNIVTVHCDERVLHLALGPVR